MLFTPSPASSKTTRLFARNGYEEEEEERQEDYNRPRTGGLAGELQEMYQMLGSDTFDDNEDDLNDEARLEFERKLEESARHLTAAAMERRAEERRREERKNDVIIGKTSAIPGEADFPIDLDKTQREWMKQATPIEQEIYHETERGLTSLRMLELNVADEAFSRVLELKPHAYLWQAGIVKYYKNQISEASKILAQAISVGESRFSIPGTEERIWRHACEIRHVHKELSYPERRDYLLALKEAQANNGSDAPTLEGVTAAPPRPKSLIQEELGNGLLFEESSKPLRFANRLFEATTKLDFLGMMINRAKLRVLASKPTPLLSSSSGSPFANLPFQKNENKAIHPDDPKMWKLDSWFFLGLYFDALGRREEAQDCMKRALRYCPVTVLSEDLNHRLPLLHLKVRNWFHDDDNDEKEVLLMASIKDNDIEEERKFVQQVKKQHPEAAFQIQRHNPVLVSSLYKSITELNYRETQGVMRSRGIPHTGPKSTLQSRLLNNLLEDDKEFPIDE